MRCLLALECRPPHCCNMMDCSCTLIDSGYSAFLVSYERNQNFKKERKLRERKNKDEGENERGFFISYVTANLHHISY